ncbi:MAG: hypothetical protein M0033_07750 [Nitrospiraceae bacterium]|nr:hypothetical protein [Nitrospiraceae bacterium]MDA8326097.1 hypothetical protein [Nitrospiraceae bacterium]
MFGADIKDIAAIIKNPEDADRQFLRLSIMAELDAINLYEQIAGLTKNEDLRKVMLDVAREEKTHMGEFHSMLMLFDGEQAEEMEKGVLEVEEITERKLSRTGH